MTASMWFIPGNGGSEYIYLTSGAPTPWAGTAARASAEAMMSANRP